MHLTKRSFLIIFCIYTVFLLSGCRIVPTDSLPSTEASEAGEVLDAVTVNYGSPAFLYGFLYNNNLLVNGLQITNVDTNDVRIVCNVPGCLHRTSDSGCMNNRYINQGLSAAYQEHIVFSGYDSSKNTSALSLYYVNSDGSGLKTLVSWDEYDDVQCTHMVLVDEHLFLALELRKMNLDEDGYLSTTEALVRFYDVDMEAGSIDMLYQSESGYNAHVIGGPLYSDGLLCMEYELQTESFEDMGITEQDFYEHHEDYFADRVEFLGLKDITIIYDLNNGTYEELDLMYEGRDFAVGCFMNRKLLTLNDDIHKIICYDLDTGERSIWREDLDVNNLYQSADFILVGLMPPARGEVREYLIIEPDSEQTKSFSPAEYNFHILNECPERLLIQYYIGDDLMGNYRTLDPEYIDRATFLSWFT